MQKLRSDRFGFPTDDVKLTISFPTFDVTPFNQILLNIRINIRIDIVIDSATGPDSLIQIEI